MAVLGNTNMRTGNLRYIVRLEQKTLTGTSGTGAPIYAWTPRGSTRCSIDPASMTMIAAAKDTVLGGSKQAFDLRVLEMHLNRDIEPLTWRCIGSDGVYYDIKAVRPSNKADRMRCFCTIGASDG
jgi:hypothetical protein